MVIPYYNEAAYIGETLRSLLTQSRPPHQIILVDNASTDESTAVCQTVLTEHPHPSVLFLREGRPGKVHALETGCARVACEFTALCDADIIYPGHYLKRAVELFAQSPVDTAAIMALYVESHPGHSEKERGRLIRTARLSKILASKCFTGGGGQIFRTNALRGAGGFSASHWDFVLMDHEIVHRVHKRGGRSVYHEDMWCLHTNRRHDRSKVRWNMLDRIVYRYTPSFLGDWYFYGYLAPRFRRRKLMGLNLREQPWSTKVPVS